jgi:metal-responsive CopG/Arc/MetJ family transcriptional regulator
MTCTRDTVVKGQGRSFVHLNVRMPKFLVDKLDKIVRERAGQRPKSSRTDVILDAVERGIVEMTRRKR